MPSDRKMKFRVLRDFADREGGEHKMGDIIELRFLDAMPFVNSDTLTADLAEPGKGK